MDVEKVIEQYGDMLFAYIFKMIRNKEDSEDILQEVFLKYLNIKNPDNIGNLKSYLYKMAYRCTLDFINAKSRNSNINIRLLKISDVKTISPEDEIISNLLDSTVEKGLNLLKNDERTIFLLRVLEEMPYKEIAKIVGIRESTARKKYERARRKISDLLDSEEVLNYEY